jgi:hypothetical protein
VVIVELVAREVRDTDPETIAQYREQHVEYRAASVLGEEAIKLIERTAEEHARRAFEGHGGDGCDRPGLTAVKYPDGSRFCGAVEELPSFPVAPSLADARGTGRAPGSGCGDPSPGRAA